MGQIIPGVAQNEVFQPVAFGRAIPHCVRAQKALVEAGAGAVVAADFVGVACAQFALHLPH